MPRVHAAVALLGALTIALAACGGSSSDPAISEAPTSGAVCPPGGTTLTYANFGAAFFGSHCAGCHNPPIPGVPAHANFSGLANIRDHAGLIDQRAAKGPARTNTAMPILVPPATGPSDAERTDLGVWLACGAPP
jgi:cytochrome c5